MGHFYFLICNKKTTIKALHLKEINEKNHLHFLNTMAELETNSNKRKCRNYVAHRL